MVGARGWRRWLVHLLAGTMVVLGLVVLSPPVPADAICNGASWYGGRHYCPGSIDGIKTNRYGPGRRAYLAFTTVSAVTSDEVVIYQHVPCTSWCAPEGHNTYLTLSWSGTGRPQPKDIVRLYGTTTVSNLVPAGYVKLGVVPPCDPYGDCYP